MKIIDVENQDISLDELMNMAKQEFVVLQNSSGQKFVLCQMDEFEAETEFLKKNKEFTTFLQDLSRELPEVAGPEFQQLKYEEL